MKVLVTLLDANLKLHRHAAKALAKAVEEQRFLMRPTYLLNEHLFFQAYLALREVEVRELRLLHETALLEERLKREAQARILEQKLEKTLKAQAAGDGKNGGIVTKKDLKRQEKVVNKDRKQMVECAEAIIAIYLKQHEALIQAATLFKGLDHSLVLVQPRADRKFLKAYTRAGGKEHSLLKLVVEEVQFAQPLDLAKGLEAHRRKMRHHMTALSHARRQFTTLIHAHIPIVGVL